MVPVTYFGPEQKEAVGFLCADLPGEDGKEPVPIGTCFFVAALNSAGERFDYIITAKHVLEDLRNAGGTTYVRLNKGTEEQQELGVIYLPLGDNQEWIFHEDDHVDLAVLPKRIEPSLRPNEQPIDSYRFLLLDLRELERVADKAIKDGFYWPPLEGEDVLFVAMMIQFLGSTQNQPIVRRGHIALMTKEPISGRYGPSDYYVIEAQAYPGNSGALVAVMFGGKSLYILGVLTFAYPELEELKQVKDTQNAYYNLGLGLVTPIEKVVDILNSKAEKRRREKSKGKGEPGIPLSAQDEEPPVEFTRDDFRDALRRVSRSGGKEVIEKRDQASSET